MTNLLESMREQLLQFGVVGAFGALCFGCGYLIAFIVTRNGFRDEMIKRRRGHTTGRPANLNGESRRKKKNRGIRSSAKRPPLPAAVVCRRAGSLLCRDRQPRKSSGASA